MTPLQIQKKLNQNVQALKFSLPITHVYNPLDYAWKPHSDYLKKYGSTPRKIILLGMNPGPWGMAQNGVPFGEINLVKNWLKISGKITKPKNEHPKRLIDGWDCTRSEVSGKRLWGWIQKTFQTPEKFFERFMVLNYCPLVFMEESGKNFTPDKLPVSERKPLQKICDDALLELIDFYQPEYAIGVGGYAKKCFERILGKNSSLTIGSILHPSPASPKANRGWSEFAEQDFTKIGISF